MSLVVFAGSAQFMLVQLAAANTPIPIMVLSGFIINLRHILYSASIAPFTKKLSVPWKIVLSYLLTDEAYAVTIAYFAKKTDTMRHYYFLGAGIALWGSWQLSTWVGLLVGSQIPSNWSLDFALPLTFIALVIPLIKDKPSLLAALSSGATALVTVHFPYKIGLLVSAFVGILIGLWSEKS
jgi:predicted branched-subunit amino acid permease